MTFISTLRLPMVSLAILFALSPAHAAENTPPPAPIYYMDLTALEQVDLKNPQQVRYAWDTLHLVASVQGIVNRRQATLFVRFMKQPDDFWFDYLRQPGNWLASRPVRNVRTVEELLGIFGTSIAGVVAYREENRSTSNVASTIAGVEDRVCLRVDPAPDSVYSRVMATGLPLTEHVLRLFRADGSSPFAGQAGSTIPDTGKPGIPSSGSAKCDAYLWTLHRYGKDGGVSPRYLAYYIDTYWLTKPVHGLPNCTLTNHDFFIANRSFFFDLNMWDDELPIDDPKQPMGADVRTLKTILRSTHDRNGGKVFSVGGFVPWAWKYTSHDNSGSKRDGVASEWQYAKTLSGYNAVMDADALGVSGLANASFYQHFPRKDHYPQNRRPTLDDLKAKGLVGADGRVTPFCYVLFYLGDYDSAAWLNYHLPLWWRDPARGTIPCAWAFNPNLEQRCPQALDYARTHQSAQDWFMSGDCGAGYLNPGMLPAPRPDPQVPDGLNAWVEHNLGYYRRYDLSITGFIIDGYAPKTDHRVMEAYQKFSPDGIVRHQLPGRGLHNHTMPYVSMAEVGFDPHPEHAGLQVAGLVGKSLPDFLPLRTILYSPTWHKQTMEYAQRATNGDKLRFVDPYTFFLLLKAENAKTTDSPVARYHAVIKSQDKAVFSKAALELRRWMEVRDPHRPTYHTMGPMDFTFDVNGPIYHDGKYHLFYLNGASPHGCHRGHMASTDLVHWEDWPVAMWPDTPWDREAVFSGNLVIDTKGIPTFLYTGNASHQTARGVLARSHDGMLTWQKKLVMDKPPYPGTPVHWDGQLWKDGGTWYQLCGGTYSNAGTAVLWSSPDLENWTYRKRIYTTDKYGSFWELPYLLPFGEKSVLIIGVSPVRYWVGVYDKTAFVFKPDKDEAEILDVSPHFYAPNPHMVDDKGPGGSQRRLMFGWVRGGKSPTREVPYWDGNHSVPRVLKLEADKLLQEPIPELQLLRHGHVQLKNRSIESAAPGLLKDVTGDALEVIASFDPKGATARRFGVKLRMSKDGKEQTVVYYEPATGRFGVAGAVVDGAISDKVNIPAGQRVTLHIFLDRSAVEVFAAGRVITKRTFSDPASRGLDVFCDGGSVNLETLDIWQMKSIWD